MTQLHQDRDAEPGGQGSYINRMISDVVASASPARDVGVADGLIPTNFMQKQYLQEYNLCGQIVTKFYSNPF